MVTLYETLSYNNSLEEVAPQVLDWLVIEIPKHTGWTHVKTVDGALRAAVQSDTRREVFKCTGAGSVYGLPFDFFVGITLTTHSTALHFQLAEDFNDVTDEWFNPNPLNTSVHSTAYNTNADGGLGWQAKGWTGLWQQSTSGGYHDFTTTAGTAYVIIRDDGIYIGSTQNDAQYLGAYEPLVEYWIYDGGNPSLPIEGVPLIATPTSALSHATTSTTGAIPTRASWANWVYSTTAESQVWKRSGPGHNDCIWTMLLGQVPGELELFTGKALGTRLAVRATGGTTYSYITAYGAVHGLFIDLVRFNIDTGVSRMDTVTIDGVKWMMISSSPSVGGLFTPIPTA